MAVQAIAMAILVTEVIREVMDFPKVVGIHKSWCLKVSTRWQKWYSSSRFALRSSLPWESRHPKYGKVSCERLRDFFQKKKSYVLGEVPFDEVYKGDCLTLVG